MRDQERPTLHAPALGFRVWRREKRGTMTAAHTHPDIEFNYPSHAELPSLHGGTTHVVKPGRLAVFWGGVPHQTLAPNSQAAGIWITLPLAWFLQWQLPNGFAERLLTGELVQAETPGARLEQWLEDYESQDPRRHHVLLLEIEAWLVRLALVARASPRRPRRNSEGVSQIERITGYIATHYHEAINVSQIARAVGLHPKYLMRLFKRQCHLGVWEYLTRLRLSHAQRLLVTTERRITDLALESGFGSPAAFYQAFSAYTPGEKPRDYRRRHFRETPKTRPK